MILETTYKEVLLMNSSVQVVCFLRSNGDVLTEDKPHSGYSWIAWHDKNVEKLESLCWLCQPILKNYIRLVGYLGAWFTKFQLNIWPWKWLLTSFLLEFLLTTKKKMLSWDMIYFETTTQNYLGSVKEHYWSRNKILLVWHTKKASVKPIRQYHHYIQESHQPSQINI